MVSDDVERVEVRKHTEGVAVYACRRRLPEPAWIHNDERGATTHLFSKTNRIPNLNRSVQKLHVPHPCASVATSSSQVSI